MGHSKRVDGSSRPSSSWPGCRQSRAKLGDSRSRACWLGWQQTHPSSKIDQLLPQDTPRCPKILDFQTWFARAMFSNIVPKRLKFLWGTVQLVIRLLPRAQVKPLPTSAPQSTFSGIAAPSLCFTNSGHLPMTSLGKECFYFYCLFNHWTKKQNATSHSSLAWSPKLQGCSE